MLKSLERPPANRDPALGLTASPLMAAYPELGPRGVNKVLAQRWTPISRDTLRRQQVCSDGDSKKWIASSVAMVSMVVSYTESVVGSNRNTQAFHIKKVLTDQFLGNLKFPTQAAEPFIVLRIRGGTNIITPPSANRLRRCDIPE